MRRHHRHPDKKPDLSRAGRDWFGIGGVVIKGEDNNDVRTYISDFSAKWRLRKPIHMTDMLAEKKGFAWLGKLSQERRDEFWSDWKKVLRLAPAIGFGCVIDRPGYVNRGYLEQHDDRWLLCRSAFDITVERAVKYARMEGRKLHIVFEQDPGINAIITEYFNNLKSNGLGFDQQKSRRYAPLTQAEFAETLGRIQHKPKAHPILQLADTYVYAMARGKYDRTFGIYRHLRDYRRIADFALSPEDAPNMGIKYYCFD
jgi:hypothetical protein